MAYIPAYIRHTVHKRPREKLNASEYNNILNLLIRQGNNNTDGIVDLLNRTEVLEADTIKVGTVEEGPTADVTITGEKPERYINFVIPKVDVEEATLEEVLAILEGI